MSRETYCPECKQYVPHNEGECCPNCGCEFEVLISKVELEELISGLETFRHHVRNLGDLDEGERRASDIADSLREKYLGGAS